MRRKIMSFLIALTMVFAVLMPSTVVYAEDTGVTAGEFLNAPQTVKWIGEESDLILGVSPVEEATSYELKLTVSSKDFICSMNYANPEQLKIESDGLYHFDINEAMDHWESSAGKDLSGELEISVYAIKGKFSTIRSYDGAQHTDITTSAYQSHYAKMVATPTPTNVQLTLSDDNKLVVRFDKVTDADNRDAYEYRIQFSDADASDTNSVGINCYNNDGVPFNLLWSVSADEKTIEVTVTDFVREYYLKSFIGKRLKVRVAARTSTDNEEGTLKYKISDWSDYSSEVNYQGVTATAVKVSNDVMQSTTGTTTTIDIPYTSIETLLKDDAKSGVSALKLEVKGNAESQAFSDDTTRSHYSTIVPFEVSLKAYKAGDETGTEIHETKTSLLITIPIPERLKGKTNLGVLIKHDNVVKEIGSVVDATNNTISFYTDQFSDYAIVEKANTATVEPKTYIVTFRANGGSGADSTQTVSGGAATNLMKNVFTRSGYTFTGWNTAADGSGRSYADAESISITENTDLYAQWKADSTPSYSGGGSTTPTVNKTTAVKAVGDATASAKSMVSDSTLSTAAKDLAAFLIDQIKADADKAISSAMLTSDANTAASDAEEACKEIIGRVKKAEAITDVSDSGDQKEAVQYGIVKGYIQGTSDTTFSPKGNVTRAQFVVFLYRLAGSPTVKGVADFNDIKDGAYLGGSNFAAAIKWASDNKITEGLGDGSFNPGGTVTREQAVAFLHRYFKGKTGISGNTFKDVKSDAWYAEDVSWGVSNGVIHGYGDDRFGVGDYTTRGQAVQFIFRALNQ